MTVLKTPMSTSYKAVFVFSILMMFLVFIGGSMNGSKSSGVGVWFWGYTAWKMYKRDNESLVSLQKIMLWFEAIAFSIALAVLLFSDSDVRRYVDVTPLELILMAALSMGVTFALYKYFVKQVQNPNISNSSSYDEELWSKVSDELKNGQRVDSLWTRAFAESDGDSNKANARYIKMRFEQIRQEAENFRSSTSDDNQNVLKLTVPPKKPIGTGVILIGVAIFAYGSLYFLKDYKNSVGSSSNASSNVPKPYEPVYSKSQIEAQNSSSPKISSCYFEWNSDTRKFDRLNDTHVSYFRNKSYVIPRLGFDSIVDEKLALLRLADRNGDVNVAKTLAKEIQTLTITVYHKPDTSPNVFMDAGAQARLSELCLR